MKAGWEVKELSECLDAFKISTKVPKKKFKTKGDFPIISQEADFINGYWDAEEDACKVKKPIVVFGDHTQVTKYVDFDFVVGADGVKVLNPKKFLEAKFLKYFIEANPMPSLGYARHYRHMKSLPIPLPPLAEQKRIVSILDEAFEGLDRARENAEANLKSARELFESVLQETLGSKYQVEREVTLGEVCILAQGLAINKTTKHLLVSKSSKPLLRIKDLRSGSVEQYVAEEGYPSGAEVSADDIIYTRTGQIGLVFRGFSGVLHNNCFSIRCINGLDQNYCFWWLQERNFRRQIVRLASRAAQPDITHKIFKAQEVTLPNEDNQKLAVVSIERAFDQMQKLQTTYQTKLQDISDLRQSLLQKAFAGELT